MKFLIDRCAGRRLADWLREQGHDVVEVRSDPPDPGDRVILERAVADQRVLLTIDTDFGYLVFVEGALHHGIVRLPDVPAARRIALMSDILAAHADDIEAGSIITVRGDLVRIARRSPRPPVDN